MTRGTPELRSPKAVRQGSLIEGTKQGPEESKRDDDIVEGDVTVAEKQEAAAAIEKQEDGAK